MVKMTIAVIVIFTMPFISLPAFVIEELVASQVLPHEFFIAFCLYAKVGEKEPE